MLNRKRRDKKLRSRKERSAGGNCAKYPHKFLEHIIGDIVKDDKFRAGEFGMMEMPPDLSLGAGVFVWWQQKMQPDDLEWPRPEIEKARAFMNEHGMEEIASGVHPRIVAFLVRGDIKTFEQYFDQVQHVPADD
jgi:hypothetical protein